MNIVTTFVETLLITRSSQIRLEFNHDFNWNDVKILDYEPLLNKCLISEMLFIKRQKNDLNLKTNTECLHQAYVTALDKLPNI